MKTYTVIVNSDGTIWWCKEGTTQLHREGGPAIELSDGTKKWWINGKRHREDGPAIEWADGTKEWYVNGELHREDGPAVERADGIRRWYVDGKQLTEQEFNNKTNDCDGRVVEIDGQKYKLTLTED